MIVATKETDDGVTFVLRCLSVAWLAAVAMDEAGYAAVANNAFKALDVTNGQPK